MKIENFSLDRDFAKVISKLKRLTTLAINSRRNPERSVILFIVSHLTKLTELELSHVHFAELVEIVRCGSMEEDLFMKIRDVVVKRRQQVPLVLYFSKVTINVSKKLLNANKNIYIYQVKDRYKLMVKYP